MGVRRRFATSLLVPLFAAGLMTGCASGTGTPGTAASGESSGSVSAPGSVPPTATPSTGPSGAPSAGAGPSAGAELTLSGQVEAGVEPGCLLLRSGGQSYLLIGGDRTVVKAGNNLVVRGHIADDVMSHCMQGRPFWVDEARPA
ncbi:hypothetical protein ACNTMW_28700 [Planosporangium sp. 12N6]|uniref:hypothetical protein n=1 Tax=Planosporangium spinosum TaxID=3402278 RepID=UPI003CF11E58